MSRTLISFFSASGQTKRFSWRNSQTYQLWYLWNKTESSIQRKWFRFSRSTIECKNRKSRPELADKNANISKYNTILVGFPVWWYIAPNIILTFLESYNFTGKKIVVWGTSWSSGMGNTTEEIRNIAKGANVVEGVIFDKDHRNTSAYRKFISNLRL